MFRNLMTLSCSAALLLASASAFAQDWYGALHVGKGWKSPADMTMPFDLAAPSTENFPDNRFVGSYEGDLKYKSGWGVGAALGRAYGNWRVEGELGYRASKISGFEASPDEVAEQVGRLPSVLEGSLGRVDVTGRVKLLTGTLNLYYDMPVSWAVRPYVGVGLGVVRARKQKDVDLSSPAKYARGRDGLICDPTVCIERTSDRDTAWDFNWQVMGGFKYAFNERWNAALGWRYTDLKGVDYEFVRRTRPDGVERFLGGGPLMVQKNSMHSVELTLIRWF